MTILQKLLGQPNIEKLIAKRDIQGLIKALGYKKDIKIRKAAVLALGDLKDTSAIETLISCLNDSQLSSFAAQALLKIGAPVVEPLIKLLKNKEYSPDFSVRDRRYNVEKIAEKVLVEIGAPSVKSLIPILENFKNEKSEIVVKAADILGKIGDPQAVKSLTARIADDEFRRNSLPTDVSNERVSAVEALVRIGGDIVIPGLSLGLRIDDMVTVSTVAKALEEMCSHGNKDALKTLMDAAVDKSIPDSLGTYFGIAGNGSYGGAAAIEVLGRVGNAETIKVLTTCMHDKNRSRVAAHALHELLLREAKSVSSDDLRSVIALNRIYAEIYASEEGYETTLKEVDCSQVRQLAHQELANRGLEV